MATKKTFIRAVMIQHKMRTEIMFEEPVFFEAGDLLEIHIRPDPEGGFLFPEYVFYRVEEELEDVERLQ